MRAALTDAVHHPQTDHQQREDDPADDPRLVRVVQRSLQKNTHARDHNGRRSARPPPASDAEPSRLVAGRARDHEPTRIECGHGARIPGQARDDGQGRPIAEAGTTVERSRPTRRQHRAGGAPGEGTSRPNQASAPCRRRTRGSSARPTRRQHRARRRAGGKQRPTHQTSVIPANAGISTRPHGPASRRSRVEPGMTGTDVPSPSPGTTSEAAPAQPDVGTVPAASQWGRNAPVQPRRRSSRRTPGSPPDLTAHTGRDPGSSPG